MLNDKQTARMLAKLRRFEETLEPMLFQPVAQLPAEAFRTSEVLYEIPPREKFPPLPPVITGVGRGIAAGFAANSPFHRNWPGSLSISSLGWAAMRRCFG